MQTIWDTLVYTPWWVYALFIYLIIVGIKAAKANTVSLYKLIIMPIFFAALSLHTLMTAVQINYENVLILLIAVIVGALLGWLQISRLKLQFDKKKKLIHTPGTWTILIIILVIFASKYYFGYQLAMNPQYAQHFWFTFSLLAVSGVCTGLFIGRFICYVYRMQTLPQTDLTG